jgi:hypothetical protein
VSDDVSGLDKIPLCHTLGLFLTQHAAAVERTVTASATAMVESMRSTAEFVKLEAAKTDLQLTRARQWAVMARAEIAREYDAYVKVSPSLSLSLSLRKPSAAPHHVCS